MKKEENEVMVTLLSDYEEKGSDEASQGLE